MKLVICEKNIAARRISYILSDGKVKQSKIGKTPVYSFKKNGENWEVVGLRGHILNLDYPAEYNQWTKIPPEELIDIKPCKKVSEKSIAKALKSLVEESPFLIVATDYDREGELIGVEAIELLQDYNEDLDEIKRAKFSSITGYEINQAFDDFSEVDYNLSDAGKARQVVDLAWGAVLTRFISLTSRQLGKDFLSIGRVQSPTLALLVEREREIKRFTPEPYWQILATLKKKKSFKASHHKDKFWEEKQAKDIYQKVKGSEKAVVKNVETTTNSERPPSPFNTTSFLRAATYQGLSSSKAMSIAEELYMSGLISYPRTDNTVYPRSLNIKGILNKLSQSDFSDEAQEVINNRRKYPTRGKKQSKDHPPIHPVGVPSSKKLNKSQQKVYELVCRRFLATLAKDAVSETSDVVLDIGGEEFTASGYRLIEPNWRSIYPYFKQKKQSIPPLEQGETVTASKIQLKKDKTKPPKRYNHGDLLAKMDKLSLGTKSTRHEIISKLYKRKYVVGSKPRPTSTAMAVVDALEGCDVVKPKMTAQLEKDMNSIAEGKKFFYDFLEESRKMLHKVVASLEKKKEEIKNNIQEAQRAQNTFGKCPKCRKDLVLRTSKNGKRFVGCSGYPDCKNTYSLPQKGWLSKTTQTCNKCGTPVVRVKMRGKKPWYLCLNPDCPAKNNK